MGETIKNFKDIIEDIRSSWYFRFWTLFWVICALAGFSCLIILGGKMSKNLKYEDVSVWRENVSTMSFPRFHFRSDPENTFLDYQCFHEKRGLLPEKCQMWNGIQPPISTCFAISGSDITIPNNMSLSTDHQRINCNILTNGSIVGNTLIAFELEGANVIAYGGNSYASIWMTANGNSWVMLEKATFQPVSGPTLTEWHRTLMYHSSLSIPGFYNVSIIIGSFNVLHWEQVNNYTGFMGLGDVGGFAFFMLILHTICMIVLGIFLDNNSNFLRNEAK